jgi:hypothetical protein
MITPAGKSHRRQGGGGGPAGGGGRSLGMPGLADPVKCRIICAIATFSVTSPPVPQFCRRIGSSGAVDFASGASRRRTPRRRSPGTPPVREKAAPPEPLGLRASCQLDAHRARRLTTARDRHFLRVSGSIPRTTRTERELHLIVRLALSWSNTHEKEGETLSVHEGGAYPLGPRRLVSLNASASTGEPVSSPALAQQPPPQDERNYRTDHWACRS